MKKYSRLRAVIDLDAVMYNMEMMHANIEKGTKMVVVIKTDGYGHGAVPISRMLEDVDYVWGYAVATLDEGVVLRKAGIQKPILCLGCIFPDQMRPHTVWGRRHICTLRSIQECQDLAFR